MSESSSLSFYFYLIYLSLILLRGPPMFKIIQGGEGSWAAETRSPLKCCCLITSPGWMHETSARTWCTGKTQRDQVEREVGGGIGMGNTCKSMANSCQCMTKTTTIL